MINLENRSAMQSLVGQERQEIFLINSLFLRLSALSYKIERKIKLRIWKQDHFLLDHFVLPVM